MEADQPEGEAEEPLWLKFCGPPPPPHSLSRAPIAPLLPRGPTGAATAPPPPGAAQPATAPQPPSLLTVVTRSTATTPPPPGPTQARPCRPGPPPDVTKGAARTQAPGRLGPGLCGFRRVGGDGGGLRQSVGCLLPPSCFSGVGFSLGCVSASLWGVQLLADSSVSTSCCRSVAASAFFGPLHSPTHIRQQSPE